MPILFFHVMIFIQNNVVVVIAFWDIAAKVLKLY
jgi:hypothetical protein